MAGRPVLLPCRLPRGGRATVWSSVEGSAGSGGRSAYCGSMQKPDWKEGTGMEPDRKTGLHNLFEPRCNPWNPGRT
eukprot:6728553-Prymnesium_polylepis.1